MSKSSKTQRQGFRKEFKKQSKIYVKRQNTIVVMKSDRARLGNAVMPKFMQAIAETIKTDILQK